MSAVPTSSRLVFRISYAEPFRPGNHASAVPQYRAKSALRSPARPNTARSYADDTWPGVSYPSGDSTCVSRAPSARALSCIRAAVARQPPLSAASTRTASLPERRNTPRHKSATRYVRPSAIPTRLLPAPIPASSSSLTRCRMPAGRVGSTVRANSVFKVLAGGSSRCALRAASTSPVPASATSHDSAESRGTRGTSAVGRTWVPGRYSSDGRGVTVCGPLGGSGSSLVRATAAEGASASSPAAQSAQVVARAREINPIFIRST
ncbi:hypothetical protein SAMN04487981_105313 [Streptomyces sp. cf386]|nr:hypothetical protein SAMN04487981_105313 [Streptomyces sp. cf386]